MSSKILVDDYPSLVESRLGGYEESYLITQSNILVNPKFKSAMGKKIIINLPIELPLEDLISMNRVESRFNIGYNIPVVPYKLPDDRLDLSAEEYSPIILTKWMIEDLNYSKQVDKSNFLLGLGEEIDGDATLVGYIISKTKIENFK